MSKYTTGEIAKLCGVSVRTVQYYDSRGILVPSELSEGGRRLYSEEDVRRMKIICFLREIDIPIKSIGELLKEEHSEVVVSMLLEQQEKKLRTEIAESKSRLSKLNELRQHMKEIEHFSVESIGDVAYVMENRKKLRKLRANTVIIGIMIDIVEVSTLLLWTLKGIWQPFVVSMSAALAVGVWISYIYLKKVAYICPQCHAVFYPAFRQAFLAGHTPNTRKLTCEVCGHYGFCVEVYKEEKKNE